MVVAVATAIAVGGGRGEQYYLLTPPNSRDPIRDALEIEMAKVGL